MNLPPRIIKETKDLRFDLDSAEKEQQRRHAEVTAELQALV